MMYTEEEYYHKADNLVRSSRIALQSLFYTRWKESQGSDWSPNQLAQFKNGPGLSVFQTAKSIQKQQLETGNVEKWDIPLLSKIIVALRSSDKTNDTRRKQENNATQRLAELRNKLSHNAHKMLSAEAYREIEHAFRSAFLWIRDMTEVQVEKLISNAGVTSSIAALEQARTIQEKGDNDANNGNLNQAIEHYCDALMVPSLLPVNQGTLYEKRAQSYFLLAKESGDSPELVNHAEQDVDQALECNPNSWKAHYLKGAMLLNSGKISEALEYFTRALAISPGQAQVKDDFETCHLLAGHIQREGFINPHKIPMKLSEYVDRLTQAPGGFPMTTDKFLELSKNTGVIVPGQEHVVRGHQYSQGWGVPQNFQEAARHFHKAARMKNAEGMYLMAIMHLEGKGVRQDVGRALDLLKEAAEMSSELNLKVCNVTLRMPESNPGVFSAQHCLGILYSEGVHLPLDYSKAIHWYKKATMNGSGQAALNLGCMYWYGNGSPRNVKSAEIYWKQALECNRNMYAAYALSHYYLEQMEYILAREMFDQAVELGYDKLLKIKGTFLKTVEKLEKEKVDLEREVCEFEASKGLHTDNLTFLERVERKVEFVDSEGAECPEPCLDLMDVDESNKDKTGRRQVSAASLQQLMIEARTSITARRIIDTIEHSKDFSDLWGSGPPFSDDVEIQLIDKLYAGLTMEHVAFQSFVSGRHEFFQEMLIKYGYSNHPLDMKVRLCYGVLHKVTATNDAIDVLTEALRRYPEEIHLYYFLANIHGVSHNFANAVKFAEKGLLLSPKNVELLYTRAIYLGTVEYVSYERIRKAFQEVLQNAPRDHRHVPDAYYQIAFTYSAGVSIQDQRNKNKLLEALKNARKYASLGQRSEAEQLSYNLPISSNAKKCVPPTLRGLERALAKLEDKVEPAPGTSTSLKEENPGNSKSFPDLEGNKPRSYMHLVNHVRIELVTKHREEQKLQRDLPSTVNSIFFTKSPDQANTNADVSNFKPIQLKEMDSSVSRSFNGRLLHLTFIEDPLLGNDMIRLLAEDENGEVVGLHVTNHSKNFYAKETLGFGCRVSVANPFLTILPDMQTAIHVDDPKDLIFKEKVANMCRYCGEKDAPLRCAQCKWATYCNRKCQKADWKNLSHKLICIN